MQSPSAPNLAFIGQLQAHTQLTAFEHKKK